MLANPLQTILPWLDFSAFVYELLRLPLPRLQFLSLISTRVSDSGYLLLVGQPPKCFWYLLQFSSVQSLSRVQLFETPARQASLLITISRSSLRLTSIESVMPSSHLILGHPLLLLPPISPSIRVFPMSQLFAWGIQSTGVSALASFLPKKYQGWSPSEWTGWISLQSKGLSRVFSNTTAQTHQFFGTQLSSQSNSHIHTWPLEKA